MAEIQKLQRTRAFLERVDKRVIQRNDDRVILVVGDEGVGKSTLMCQLAAFWQDIRDRDQSPEAVLDNMVWGEREAFNDALKNGDEGDMIAVQDAPHVLFSRDVMKGEQKKTEKNLMDIRFRNYLIVLGFQDWSDIPSGLAQRRAKNTFHIPRRGVIHGYNRESMDRRYKSGEWPDPDFEDRFPSLEGTELWAAFQERDEAAKMERLEDQEDLDPSEAEWQKAVEVALKAIKPWAPDHVGLSQPQAAELVGYSQSWVSDRKQEWERGYHRELFEDDATVPTGSDDGSDSETAAD